MISLRSATVHRDGDTLHRLLLHTLQILHVLHLELHLVAVHESWLQLGSDIHGGTLCEHAVPAAPVLAKQGNLSTTLEVLDGDEATGLPTLRELLAHSCHNATQDDILAPVEL